MNGYMDLRTQEVTKKVKYFIRSLSNHVRQLKAEF